MSKLAATELVLGSGLDAVVLRVFSPVGPGTPAGSPLGRLAEAMRRAMQSGESELKLSGLGVQRDFVDVRDVARAVHAASLSAAQGVVNIGSGRAVRLREAASVLARVAGFGGALHEIDGPPGRVPAAVGHIPAPAHPHGTAHAHATAHGHAPAHPQAAGEHGGVPGGSGNATTYPYPDGCGSWQQADVRTARDRLGWRSRIPLEESLADIWMEAACRI